MKMRVIHPVALWLFLMVTFWFGALAALLWVSLTDAC